MCICVLWLPPSPVNDRRSPTSRHLWVDDFPTTLSANPHPSGSASVRTIWICLVFGASWEKNSAKLNSNLMTRKTSQVNYHRLAGTPATFTSTSYDSIHGGIFFHGGPSFLSLNDAIYLDLLSIGRKLLECPPILSYSTPALHNLWPVDMENFPSFFCNRLFYISTSAGISFMINSMNHMFNNDFNLELQTTSS